MMAINPQMRTCSYVQVEVDITYTVNKAKRQRVDEKQKMVVGGKVGDSH